MMWRRYVRKITVRRPTAVSDSRYIPDDRIVNVVLSCDHRYSVLSSVNNTGTVHMPATLKTSKLFCFDSDS